MFSKPGQKILNQFCSQLRIPEQSEVIDKLKNEEITQRFSYFLEFAFGGFCLHLRIPDHAEITDLVENLHTCGTPRTAERGVRTTPLDQPVIQKILKNNEIQI